MAPLPPFGHLFRVGGQIFGRGAPPPPHVRSDRKHHLHWSKEEGEGKGHFRGRLSLFLNGAAVGKGGEGRLKRGGEVGRGERKDFCAFPLLLIPKRSRRSKEEEENAELPLWRILFSSQGLNPFVWESFCVFFPGDFSWQGPKDGWREKRRGFAPLRICAWLAKKGENGPKRSERRKGLF